MYKILRSLLFLIDPERAHYVSMGLLKNLNRFDIFKTIIKKSFAPPSQKEKIAGLEFRNIIGLGAGFDKNAVYLNELDSLGFGFVEIGTVTPIAQSGNELPRLFRLKKDKALINRMGFNNAGMVVVKENIKAWRKNNPSSDLIIGGNIGKNKVTPNEEAWQDYLKCFKMLYDEVDYFVVNVSSPNTPGLRELQEKDSLQIILTTLQKEREKFSISKPIFLKISPDLSLSQVDIIIALSLEINLDGLIIANTTLSREDLKELPESIEKIGAGGLSGKPLSNKSNDLLIYISERTNNKLVIISSGGIFTKEDVELRRKNGADLVQIWTSFIYEGPGILKNLI